MNLVRDGGLYYLHYTIHFLDMQLSLSITQSISKLPKSSTGGSLYQSYSPVSSSSLSRKRRSSSVTGMSSRLSCLGTNVTAVTTMSPSWRATCTVARFFPPYCWNSDVLGRADGMAKNITFKVEYKKKDYGCLFNDVFCGAFCIVFFVVFA